MPGINLKHYDDYLTRIELYARACGIKIKYDSKREECSYEPHRRILRMDPTLSQSAEIASLLHELGHALDDTLLTGRIERRLSLAYVALYAENNTRGQLNLVIECEERAWKYARAVAKKLRIKLGKWFDDYKDICIEDYKT